MAKTSMIERNNKRQRLAKKYKTKRTRLKAIAADRKLPAEERFAARTQACRAAAQLLADAHPQSVRPHGAPARLLPQAAHVAYRAARSRKPGPDPRHDQVELVRTIDEH